VSQISVYVIAGEPSGDAIGALLVQSLIDSGAKVYGIGGRLMERMGVKSLFDISKLSIGGITEIASSIISVKKLINATTENILQKNPDVVVTIDSPEFCFRVAKQVKKKSNSIKLVHYVAPSVWAWRPKRVKEMALVYDHLLTLFDFEPQYFTPCGLPTTFVGHQAYISFSMDSSPKTDKILVLPGSRPQEIKRMLPIFMDVSSKFGEKVVIPTLPHLVPLIKDIASQSIIETDESSKINLFKTAKCAIAASGTVTLELALSGCPMVVAYKVSPLSFVILKRLVKVNFISLPNIIANKCIVPELMQKNCDADKILEALKNINSQKQRLEFQKIRERLINKGKTPADIATEVIFNLMKSNYTKTP
jgi:lipid-A-disaccharide synthase